jgi:hypothetical protein
MTAASRILGAGAICALLVAATATSSSVADRERQPRDVDLTAAAHPGPGRTTVVDKAFGVSTAFHRDVHADTSATTSATCDGCAGKARALQVLYVRRARDTTLDNQAVAWAQCESCRAAAVSMQVVVVRGTRAVTANNRALALNAACTDCRTSSLAYQLVVVEEERARLSPDAVADLRAWVDRRAADLLGGARAAGSLRAGSPVVQRVEDLVNDELGSATLLVDVDSGTP